MVPAIPPAAAVQPAARESIVVKARRLDRARIHIQAELGATVTRFSPKALAAVPQGENAPLSQVLLQAPGVAQDSFGQIHVRGDHNEVQYRLDGVQLPEGLAVFGQALQTRFAHALSLITGALPAQYGFLQAAVVDITARSGASDPGGTLAVTAGARDDINPSASYGGVSGDWDYYAVGDFLHTRVGIENPTSSFNAIHDLSNQYHGLAHVDYTPDDATRISLIGGVSRAEFQIPNNPGQRPMLGLSDNGVTGYDSAALTEHQREITEFAILSWQQKLGSADFQLSAFSRYSSLAFSPDPTGDLLFTGLAQIAARSVWSSGVQGDVSWTLSPSHTLRAGFQITGERALARTDSSVFQLDASGQQGSALPETIFEKSGKTGGLYGAYMQDEWKVLHNLTVNAGVRFDVVDEFTHENQISPRVNLVYVPAPGTDLHAGYAHYLTPPPFELVTATDIGRFAGTTAAPTVLRDDIVRAEHDNYFDAGISQRVAEGCQGGFDFYYKLARDLIDEGQFGAPIILEAFNYRRAQVGGVEFTTSYERGPWSLYANLAISRAIGKDIVSAQYNFQPDELAYIAAHYIHLDHDQRFTGSGGIAYTAGAATDHAAQFSTDVQTGSGLRTSAPGVPNGAALPGYYVINASWVQRLDRRRLPGLTARLDILNLLDRRYEIRNGQGVGVGAPQFGLRRTILVGISQRF